MEKKNKEKKREGWFFGSHDEEVGGLFVTRREREREIPSMKSGLSFPLKGDRARRDAESSLPGWHNYD